MSVLPPGRHCSLNTNVNWKESWANCPQLYEQLFNAWKSYAHVEAWYNCYFSLLRFASDRYFTSWQELSTQPSQTTCVTSFTSYTDHGYMVRYIVASSPGQFFGNITAGKKCRLLAKNRHGYKAIWTHCNCVIIAWVFPFPPSVSVFVSVLTFCFSMRPRPRQKL